jgi:enoyl-CoA hydratase/carnithine racemase
VSLRIDRPAPGVLGLWLDRPAVRNALDRPLVQALLDALEVPAERAVVLGSTDAACFCAGADVTLDDAERAQVSDLLYELYGRMLRLPVPIVAAVSGHAVGGGAQLAIASDLRVGSASTQFRFPGTGHGLAVGAWGLPSLIGRGRALDLCLTMRPVAAKQALAFGLLDRVEKDAARTAIELAATLTVLDAEAVHRTKRIVLDATDLVASLERERYGNRGWSGSTDGMT